MNKSAIKKLEEDPAAMKRWLTTNFGKLYTVEEGPGVFVTMSQQNLRIASNDRSIIIGRVTRRIEGDGRTPEASVRDFFEITRGIRPGQQHLVLGRDNRRVELTSKLEVRAFE